MNCSDFYRDLMILKEFYGMLTRLNELLHGVSSKNIYQNIYKKFQLKFSKKALTIFLTGY